LFAGVPARKLVMGVPFYGRGWEGVPETNGGLFQPYEKTFAGGAYEYREVKTKYLPGFTRYWDDAARAPWLYSPEQKAMISYDDPDSVRAKAEFARKNNLGGMMIWQIAGDDPDSSLLRALTGN
jgi:chitinase